MSAASSRSSTTRPFQRLASPKLTCSTADCSRVRPPGTGSTTGSPAGSPSVPVSVRSRRKPSAPVSRSPSRPQHRAVDRQRRDPQAAAGLADAADPRPCSRRRRSRGSPAAPAARSRRVKSTSKPRPSSLERSATSPSAIAGAAGVEREADVDAVERPRALGGQVDRRLALDPEQRGDDAALRLVQVEVDVELPGGVGEAGPAASARRRGRRGGATARSLSSTPRARLSEPPTEMRAGLAEHRLGEARRRRAPARRG